MSLPATDRGDDALPTGGRLDLSPADLGEIVDALAGADDELLEGLQLDAAALESDPWVVGRLYAAAFERVLLEWFTSLALYDEDCETL